MTAISYKTVSSLALTGAAALCLLMPVSAKAEAFTPEQKAELKTMLDKYIMDNPELIMRSVDEFRVKQQQRTQQDAQANLAKHKEFFGSKELPGMGNPDGDITLIEYFDYNCGYCKRMFHDLTELVKEDKNVRVVLKDLPILSPASEIMARLSLAAHKQGKYFEMHSALMEYRGEQTEEAFLEVAKKAGLDVEKLKADKNDPAIDEALKKNRETAADLGVQGTPGIVIGDQIFRGYIGLDGVKQSLKEERAKTAAAPAAEKPAQ